MNENLSGERLPRGKRERERDRESILVFTILDFRHYLYSVIYSFVFSGRFSCL